MYEYKVVPVREVRELEQVFNSDEIFTVSDDDGEPATLEHAIEVALSTYAAEGWKLHTSHVLGESNAVLIFERITRESAKKLMATLEAGATP